MAQHATPKDGGCGYGPIQNTTKYVDLSFEKKNWTVADCWNLARPVYGSKFHTVLFISGVAILTS